MSLVPDQNECKRRHDQKPDIQNHASRRHDCEQRVQPCLSATDRHQQQDPESHGEHYVKYLKYSTFFAAHSTSSEVIHPSHRYRSSKLESYFTKKVFPLFRDRPPDEYEKKFNQNFEFFFKNLNFSQWILFHLLRKEILLTP